MGYWFKRRRYGWGWTPVTWQGWLIIALYVLVLVAAGLSLAGADDTQFGRELGFFLLIVTLATASLLRITYRTAPKPKLRWGAKSTDNPDEDF